VNLRQSFYSPEILSDSMRQADIVKLNDEELPKIMSLAGFPHEDEISSAQRLIREHNLEIVCVTRGCRGSLLVQCAKVNERLQFNEHPGFKVRVADTVGSGDAFTAGLIHEYLHGASLELMNEVANRMGAWVASEAGAMPVPKGGALEHSLAEIR
jgi:fructokinase